MRFDYDGQGCSCPDPQELVIYSPSTLSKESVSLFSVTDVSTLTGECVASPLVAWQTPNGSLEVEHLAGMSPNGDLLVFWWSPAHDWQVVNVSQITGEKIASALTAWQTPNGPYNVEHLAGMSPNGDLLAFWWSPAHDWQVVNVSQITGEKIASALTAWQTPNGPYNVEHLAGMSPNGDLLVFWWSPAHDWQVVNVSQITGEKIASALTAWQTPNGPYNVEHLAGMSPYGDALVFWWSPARDWQVVNVSDVTGRKVASALTVWQTASGAINIEHLGAMSPNGDLIVFWWSPEHDWMSVDVTRVTGQKIEGPSTIQQEKEGAENFEILGSRNQDGELLIHWWGAALDWQAISLTRSTGLHIKYAPTSWRSRPRGVLTERFAAPGKCGELLVFSGTPFERRLTDSMSQPYATLKRKRGVRHKVLTILWDPHQSNWIATSRAILEDALFGGSNSVRDYFLENSRGQFTIENKAVLGWYDFDYPPSAYWPMSGIGRDSGAEAIRKAAEEFDFHSADFDGDEKLEPEELGILVIRPGKPGGRGGGLTRVPGSDFTDNKTGVSVDGVKVKWICETSAGDPPIPGIFAHELAHLLLGHGDMYFDRFFNPAAATQYSLMDNHQRAPHLDPFSKLKLGWLRPRVAFRSGTYRVDQVERTGDVLLLIDVDRSLDEYFIVENRWPGQSYDTSLPDAGIAVWHVMEDPTTFLSAEPPPNVSASDWKTYDKAGDWARLGIRMIWPLVTAPTIDLGALWSGDSTSSFDLVSNDPDPTHGSLRWGDGTPSGFALRQFSKSGPTLDVVVEVPGAPPLNPSSHRYCRDCDSPAGFGPTGVSRVASARSAADRKVESC